MSEEGSADAPNNDNNVNVNDNDGSQSPDRKRQFQDDDETAGDDAARKRQALDGEEGPATTASHPASPTANAAPAPSNAAPAAAAAASGGDFLPTIAMRALIHNQDAGLIIGKGGASVAEIRQEAGARVTVSEHIPGVSERILTITGPLDHVAKAFSLVSQKIAEGQINEEKKAGLPPGPADPKMRHVQMRLLIPHPRMGGVIGKQGSKIKEIQDASGARVSASEEMLPGSQERMVTVSGVADSIHIASYHIGQVVHDGETRAAIGAQHHHPHHHQQQQQQIALYRPGAGPSMGSSSHHRGGDRQPRSAPLQHQQQPQQQAQPQQLAQQSVQIFIPNDMVGAIIGKGGNRINSIRQQSGCRIMIAEPDPNGGDRLVTITGGTDGNQMALYLLYSAMEQEKVNRANTMQ